MRPEQAPSDDESEAQREWKAIGRMVRENFLDTWIELRGKAISAESTKLMVDAMVACYWFDYNAQHFDMWTEREQAKGIFGSGD